MQLMTKKLEARFAQLGRQDKPDAIVVAKFWHPMNGLMTWYATEYDPEDRIFFGWVFNGDLSELGSFSLDEMEEIRINGLGMERDLYWTERPLSEVKKSHGH